MKLINNVIHSFKLLKPIDYAVFACLVVMFGIVIHSIKYCTPVTIICDGTLTASHVCGDDFLESVAENNVRMSHCFFK